MEDDVDDVPCITKAHFEEAMKYARRSVSDADIRKYQVRGLAGEEGEVMRRCQVDRGRRGKERKYAHRLASDTHIRRYQVRGGCGRVGCSTVRQLPHSPTVQATWFISAPWLSPRPHPSPRLPPCRHLLRRCSRAAASAPTSAFQREHQGQQGRQPRSPRRRRPLALRRAQRQLTMMTCTAKRRLGGQGQRVEGICRRLCAASQLHAGCMPVYCTGAA